MPVKTRSHKMGYSLIPDDAPRLTKPLVEPEHVVPSIHRTVARVGMSVLLDQDKVSKAYAKVDQDAVLQKHRDRHEVVVWDKKSPINGVPAKKVLRDLGHDYDLVYLVFVDGQLVVFQPHTPGEEGFNLLTGDNIEQHSMRHVEQMARSHAMQDILLQVMDHLDIKPPEPRTLDAIPDHEVPGLAPPG